MKHHSLLAALVGEAVKRTRWCQVNSHVCYLTLLKNVPSKKYLRLCLVRWRRVSKLPGDSDKKKGGSSEPLVQICSKQTTSSVRKWWHVKGSFRDTAQLYETTPFSPHRQPPEASHSVKDALGLSIDLSLLNCAAIPFGGNWIFIKDTEDYKIGSRCEVGFDSSMAVSFVEALLNKPTLMFSLPSCPT